jgi:hypothetical protein
VNRRQFLSSFAAALAISHLPELLLASNPVPAPILANAFDVYRLAPSGERLWAKLYELDPLMCVSVDYKTMAIHLFSNYDLESIRHVLWWYKPVGIFATVNRVPVVW